MNHRLHERCGAAGAAPFPFTLAGTERKYERSRPFRIQHLALDLTLDMRAKRVSGTARVELERVAPDADRIVLDAIGFEIKSVKLGSSGATLDYVYDGDQLEVAGLAAHHQAKIEIEYSAQPSRGLYFLAPDAKVKDRPEQVWSQCQDEDARHWFPCHDKPHVKMTTELAVRVPPGFVALSNGELVKVDKPSGKKPWRFHFKLDKPHPSYLVTLAVGRFAIVEDRPARLDDGRMIPVAYYVPPPQRSDAARSLGETPRMIELFSRVTGVPYPWPRYSQVVVSDFVFGGMENTTATTLYEHVLLDERAALDVAAHDLVAHELAHQWFGDYVTCRDWSHAWLNEGFATYFEHIEREDRLGRDEYDYGIQSDLDSYLSEAGSRYSRPIVCRDYAEPIDLFDRHLYEKGSLVLHSLRRELGDTLFFEGIRRYLHDHAHGIVETNDLMRAFEAVSGRSLERFFDQWVYRRGHPELKVKIGYEDGLVTVGVKQTQKTGEVATFHFDLEAEVVTRSGERIRQRKLVQGSEDSLVFALAERPAHVSFDPEFRVIGEVSVEAPSDMLRDQLANGSTAAARFSAARALSKKNDPPTIAALERCLGNRKEGWMVRAEAARSLGKTGAEAALEALARASSVDHPKARRAVMAALGSFRKKLAFDALAPRAKRDRSYMVEAEAARSLGKTREPRAFALLKTLVDRKSWGDVVRMGALDGLSALRDEQAVPIVLEHTRYGYPARGRRAALSALAELGEGKKVREQIEAQLDDADPHVRIEAVHALVVLGDSKGRSALRRALEREHDGRVKRRMREGLRELGDSAGERKRVADELETVKNELNELKARFARFEARAAAKKGDGPPHDKAQSKVSARKRPAKQRRKAR
jgi:aminopeptidase N